jgi:endonuclease-8
VHELQVPLGEMYDWRVDLMSKVWKEDFVVNKLVGLKDSLICDALLHQEVFAGSGNIIKNEVLCAAWDCTRTFG